MEYGKILNQYEVNGLRDGTIWIPQNTMTIEKDIEVTIGKPQIEPIELIESLKKYFQNQRSVNRAYNVHYFNPETDKNAHTLICIEGLERDKTIASEVGLICTSIKVPNPPIDVMFINSKDSFGTYICENFEPFYFKKKKFLGLF